MIEILKQLVIAYTALIALLTAQIPVAKEPVFGVAITIESQLEGKTQKEKANIKATEIVKNNFVGTHSDTTYGETIEIRSVAQIDGGIEVIARAWKGTEQLGFGKDGSVEWERFKIYNPPILVYDTNGTVVRQWTDSTTGELKQKKWREDPVQAIKNTLAHTIKVSGKTGTKIVSGSVGHTVSTFFPAAGANSPVDGMAGYDDVFTDWATARGHAGNSSSATEAATQCAQIFNNGSDQFRIIRRCIILFDTSAIPDADTISAATMSGNCDSKSDPATAITPNINVYLSTPAGTASLVNGDYAQVGTVAQSSAIAFADVSCAPAYNDFVLNDLTQISKTSISKYGTRNANYDVANVAPTGATGANHYIQFQMADTVGTDSDPKLVVTHAGAETGGNGLKIIIMSFLNKFINIAYGHSL